MGALVSLSMNVMISLFEGHDDELAFTAPFRAWDSERYFNIIKTTTSFLGWAL